MNLNFGKRNTIKQLKQLTARRKRTGNKFLLVFTWTILFCAIALVGFAGKTVLDYVKEQYAKVPDVADINIKPTGFLTTVYDAWGNDIEKLAASGANREYVTLDMVPEDLQHAFVAIEDERFYTHHGIDPRGIIRAGVYYILDGSTQGASTITQQLLKNNYFTDWTEESTLAERVNRKLQEQVLALQLEKSLGEDAKDIILENYLNTINLGQNTLGVEAASNRYFNKDVWDLTLSECAVIAGITQNPYKWNPITHPDLSAGRRERVLKKMLELEYITQAEFDEAMADNVFERIAQTNSEVILANEHTSYFVDALIDQVISDLIEKNGMTQASATKLLYTGGLDIYGTQDPLIQYIADEEVNNPANYVGNPQYSISFRLSVNRPDGTVDNYSEQSMLGFIRTFITPNATINFRTIEEAQAAYESYKAIVVGEDGTVTEAGESVTYTLQPQVALTIIDQYSGRILAQVGGRGEKSGSRTLNRATDTTRQPGSTFKILACYAPALDAAGKTLADTQNDEPYNYANGTPLRNFDNKNRGYMTYRDAIVDSINVVAVKALTEIGTGLGYEYVQKFGISTLTSDDNNQALAIGGITYGVKNVELTAAYAAIANQGQYRDPVYYTQVVDSEGNVILDTTQDVSREVIKPTTAWLLIDAMKEVITRGSATRARFNGMAIAGKSGTTNSERDTVFVGFSPYYTCGIWGGYDDNSPQSNLNYTQNIWRAVMSRLHEGREYRDFEKPQGIVQASVCKISGRLPAVGVNGEAVCAADPRGSRVYTEYFAEGTVPKDRCEKHVLLTLDTSTNALATEYCPPDAVRTGVFVVGGNAGSDASIGIPEGTIHRTCTAHNAETLAEWKANLEKYMDEQEEARKKEEEERRRQEEEQAAQNGGDGDTTPQTDTPSSEE